MKYKAMAACVGFVVVGAVTYLLHEPGCLWSLVLIYFIVDSIHG
ncbi:hypothetical protein JOD82_001812 [Paenibacillus sp. 1182]|nr:hypothetical protein [Paenibacillus sp. 1182]MBP1308792.1 hypothetical protein [Paenibacillus sp. 1182]